MTLKPLKQILDEIEQRVRPSICQTFSSRRGITSEGRIQEDDYDTLLRTAQSIGDRSVFVIQHRRTKSWHGRGDYSPDAPFFSSKAKAAEDLWHFQPTEDFEIIEFRELKS